MIIYIDIYWMMICCCVCCSQLQVVVMVSVIIKIFVEFFHSLNLLVFYLKILVPNGLLYFSTNFTKFILNEEQIHSTQIKDITKATTPFDFEGKLQRWCYLITK